MLSFFSDLFGMDFMPHGMCYLWRPKILWLHAGSDALIAASYFVIPVLLVELVRRRKNVSFHWIFWMFAAFILLCGSTHVLNIVTIWQPIYRFDGMLKLVTGLVSLCTAGMLLYLLPHILEIPLPEELAAANRALAQQIAVNRRTEERLRLLNSELERRVAERTAALERSNQDLTQFAYIASHDLQEPLRMVSNYTELLNKRYSSQFNEEARDFMHFVIDGARRMENLITDLLAYAQIERENVPIQETPLANAVERALEALRLSIEEERAEIQVEKMPTVLGDEAQLGQVFQNLLANSLKYRTAEPPRIAIWTERADGGNFWRVFVQDNGVGFDMKFKPQLFRMFQRLETRLPGTGIGLATCKKIIQHHGGKIDVKSEPGQGTTVFFTLRATKAVPKVI